MEKISYKHGNETIIFNKEKLEELIKEYKWADLKEFLETIDYEGIEHLLNYHSRIIIDMFRN
jgi:hypothetical protein